MKKIIALLLCLVMMLSVTACQTAEEAPEAETPATEETATTGEETPTEEEASAPAAEDEDLLICCIAGEVGIPYFTTMQWGALQAGKDLGVEVYWTGAANWDVGAQMNYIEGCLALNPDGMMICPADPESLVAYVEKWMGEGIGIVCTDSALAEHVDIIGLGSNSYDGGSAAAKYMFEVNGEGGVYQALGSSIGSYSTAQRVAGFVDTMLELNPTATILDTVYCEYETTRAAELISGVIMGNPDLSGVFAASSAAAAGASSAIIEAGLGGKVKLAAFDADPQQIEDLRSGVYDVVIAQDPYQMGYDAVEILVKYARGEVTTDDYPDATYNYPTMAITKDNVDNPECEKYKYISDVSIKGF